MYDNVFIIKTFITHSSKHFKVKYINLKFENINQTGQYFTK